jgi:amino acid permease
MYQRWFYVVTLGVPLTLVILKKELAELDWLAWVLFGSLGIFILMLCWLLFVDQSFRVQRAGLNGDIWFPDHGIGRLISAVSIILVAYGYQFNIYPIYGSLQEKTNEQYVKVNNYGLLICCVIYITVGIISIAMFGPNISSVILEDIGTATNSNGDAFWESYVIQLSFMILLVCHMPFIFFSGKEAMLIIIDEIDRKSISNALWHKLYATGKNFEQTQDSQNALPPAPELPVPGEDIAFEEAVKQ